MRLILFIISSLLFFTASAANAQIDQIEQKKTFKDWQVKCDRYNSCVATSNSELDEYGYPEFLFSIAKREFQEYWEISLVAFAKTPNKNAGVKINTDEDEIRFNSPQEFAAYGLLNQYYFLGEKAQILLDDLMPASIAKIDFTDEKNKQITISFSLSGLSASLLFIDEVQKQVGVKRIAGAAPDNIIIVSNREPDPIPQMLINEHANPTISGCEPIDELAQGEEIASFRLDAENTLYLVPCTAGAYNFSSVAYVKNDYETSMQMFASYWEGNGWSGTQYLINPDFNEKTNMLYTFYKGRGIGDCGSTGVWQWDKYSFKMLEYSAKSECDGEGELGVFPIIYQDPDYQPPIYQD